MKAVVLNKQNEIIALLKEFDGNTAEIAGAVAADGSPVNVLEYKVSRSKANLAIGAKSDAQYATKREFRGRTFYTLA